MSLEEMRLLPHPCMATQIELIQVPDPQDSSISITTSIRSDTALTKSAINSALSGPTPEPCQFYMLSYHRDRMLTTATEFAWTKAYAILDGAKGLHHLKNALREYLARKYGDPNYPQPLKVQRVFDADSLCSFHH